MSKIIHRRSRLRSQITQNKPENIHKSNISDIYVSQPKNNCAILKSRLLTHVSSIKAIQNPQKKYQEPHYITIVQKWAYPATKQKTDCLKDQKPYNIQRLIGKGTFGCVYSGFNLKTSKKVAIKKVFQDKYFKNRELSILKQLNHINILKLLDFYTQVQNNKAFLYLVTDIYTYDLCSYLQKQKIPQDLLPFYIYQILKGLLYLNQRQIAHRDLKPHNILIDKHNHRVVLCDFGCAKKINQNEKNVYYICARQQRAPQLAFGANYYTTAVDMWSLGCIIFEMVNRKPLFKSQSNSELLIDIIKLLGTPSASQITEMNPHLNMNEYKSLPSVKKTPLKNIILTKNHILIDLIQNLLVYSPNKRLSPSQALEHQYFASLTPYYMKNLQQKYRGIVNIFEQISNHPVVQTKTSTFYKIKDQILDKKTLYETLSTDYSALKPEQSLKQSLYRNNKKQIIKKLF